MSQHKRLCSEKLRSFKIPWRSQKPKLKKSACHTCHVYVFGEGSSFRHISAWCKVPCRQQQLECQWKTSELWADAQEYWMSYLLTMFLHSLAYYFSFSWRTKFQVPYFLFSSLWQHGRGKYIVPSTENYQRESLSHRSFQAILWKFGQNRLLFSTPKSCLHLLNIAPKSVLFNRGSTEP